MKAHVLVMMLLLSVFGIGGCQSGAGDEQRITADSVVLKIWGGTPPETGPLEVINRWNRLNPHLQAEYIWFENNETGNMKLETAIVSGLGVDVFIGYNPEWLLKRIRSGMVEPLDPFLQAEPQNLEASIKATIMKYGGNTYYLPASKTIEGILINKDALDEIGEAVPEYGWTWDDYANLAKKLTKTEGSQTRYGTASNELTMAMATSSFGTYCFFNSDGKSNFDDPLWRKILDIEHRLYETDHSAFPLEKMLTERIAPEEQYLSGQAAMLYGTQLVRSVQNTSRFQQAFQTTVAPLPRLTTDHPGYNGYGAMDYMSISSQSKNKQAAWNFISWYISDGFEAMAEYGRFPTWNSQRFNSFVSDYFNKHSDKFDVDAFRRLYAGDYRFFFPVAITASEDIKKILENETIKMIYNKQSPEETLLRLKERSDELIKKLYGFSP